MSSRSNALSARSSRTQNRPSSHGPCSVSAEPNSGKISAACISSTRDSRARRSAVFFASCSRRRRAGSSRSRDELIEIEVAAAHAVEERALARSRRAARAAACRGSRRDRSRRRRRRAGTREASVTRRDSSSAVDDPLHHVGDVDDAGQLAAHRLEPAAQLGALAQQPPVDAVLEPVAHRLEQDEDHERGDERVEEIQALLAAADPVRGASRRPPRAARRACRAPPSCRRAR